MDGRELKEAAAKNPLYIHFCLLYSLLLEKMEGILHASIYLLHYMIQDYRKVTCSFGS